MWKTLCVVTLATLAILGGAAAKGEHEYSLHDPVSLFVNSVGPVTNPNEKYSFYHLPMCQPPTVQHKHETLGEILEGDDLQTSLYDLRFRVQIQWQGLCKLHLDGEDVNQLINAIENYFFFEMIYDDLPVWGFIGMMEDNEVTGEREHYLFAHLHFSLTFNGPHIIHVNVSADQGQAVLLERGKGQIVQYSYSAEWTQTDVKFADRMQIYTEYNFFQRELEIHWMSIMNSLVLVLLLVGFIALLLVRVLKRDFARYQGADTEKGVDADADDYGWKVVHADVFRMPSMPSLFCSLVGNGVQLFALFFSLLVLAVVGVFYPTNRGLMQTAAIILYALTSFIAGYSSAALYKKLNGERWAWNLVQTSLLFTGPFFVIWLALNTIAVQYRSTSALPVGTVMVIVMIFVFVGFPLTVVGGIAGRQAAGPFAAPCRTRNIPREIPSMPWYREGWVQVLAAGFLPFSSCYIELYYLFASLWGHKPYSLYGILMIVFFILIVVTSCIAISLTYFQLAIEDHRWWWRSFFCGGSSAGYVMLYAVFYYVYRSEMTGTLQTAFFFGYNAAIAFAFWLFLGTVGWWSSLVFVRKIYSDLHLD
eukprot:a844710_110.p1 GENE.a844710_110~~a844710_110.p1  ORF type:complete len:601 (-),score=286.26 a844710_110:41-1810(-)